VGEQTAATGPHQEERQSMQARKRVVVLRMLAQTEWQTVKEEVQSCLHRVVASVSARYRSRGRQAARERVAGGVSEARHGIAAEARHGTAAEARV
jgi:hypothetical protein